MSGSRCPCIQFSKAIFCFCCCCSVMTDSLGPHGLQHARLPCPSPSLGACSNLYPLRQWCHPTILSSVIPFSCLQSFPASGSFLMSQLFASGGQSIRASASASVLLMNIQDWFPLELSGLMSLQSKGLSRVFSNATVQKHQFFGIQPSLWSSSHIHTWLPRKNIPLIIWNFVSKVKRDVLFAENHITSLFWLEITNHLPSCKSEDYVLLTRHWMTYLSSPISLEDLPVLMAEDLNYLGNHPPSSCSPDLFPLTNPHSSLHFSSNRISLIKSSWPLSAALF